MCVKFNLTLLLIWMFCIKTFNCFYFTKSKIFFFFNLSTLQGNLCSPILNPTKRNTIFQNLLISLSYFPFKGIKWCYIEILSIWPQLLIQTSMSRPSFLWVTIAITIFLRVLYLSKWLSNYWFKYRKPSNFNID